MEWHTHVINIPEPVGLAWVSTMNHEGFRAHVYKCPNGYDTIGNGFRLSTLASFGLAVNPDVPLNRKISEWLCFHLIARIYDTLTKRWNWLAALPAQPTAIVVEMVYQMGLQNVLGFKKMIAALRDWDFHTAGAEMLDSKWAREDSPQRAREMAEIMRGCASGTIHPNSQ